MLGWMIGLAGQAVAASAPINPAASGFFERDPAIKAWAVQKFDTNHDGWLTSFEAQPALVAFKDLADGDRDGRVTTYEYDRARDFIAARR